MRRSIVAIRAGLVAIDKDLAPIRLTLRGHDRPIIHRTVAWTANCRVPSARHRVFTRLAVPAASGNY